jgi:hypothetical protein
MVIDLKEKRHIDLLSNVSSQLQNLTLTIRRTQSFEEKEEDADASESDYEATAIASTISRTDSQYQLQLPSASSEEVNPLMRIIENMEHLTKLRIFSEVSGNFSLRSISLEHLFFQGALVLDECSCPRLITMDISFPLDAMKDDDHIIFKRLPPSIEELTLRMDDNIVHVGQDYDVDCRHNGEDSVCGVNDYEDEIQRLLLQKMVRLKRLQLVPSQGCSFLVKHPPPSSPKSISEL